jgi:hypothetical protein
MINDSYSFRELITVIGIILLSKSLYYESYGENILLIVFLGFLFFSFNILKLKIHVPVLLYISSLLFIIILNPDSQFDSVLVLIVRFSIAIFIVHILSFQKFSKIYVDIILFLSFFSISTLLIIHFNIDSFLPDFTAMDGRHIRNFVLFGVPEGNFIHGIFKNSGLWWEPGAFQLFVNLAFIFTIISNSISHKKYILFFITILTIGSTTGFIVFSLLSLIYFKKHLANVQKKYLFFLIVITASFFFFLLSYVSPLIYDKFNQDSISFISFLSRYYDFIISCNLFIDNFILGYGFGSQIENAIPYGADLIGHDVYYSLNRPTGSDGISMFIAQIGIFSFIFLAPFLVPKYYAYLHFAQKLIISVSLLLMFNTENFTFILIFTILSIYGIVGNIRQKHNETINYS